MISPIRIYLVKSSMPKRELERLQAVHRFLNLEINKDDELQEIVELAAGLCETAVALITLVDEDAHHFKANVDNDMTRRIRQSGLCQSIVQQNQTIIIADLWADNYYAAHPVVAENPQARFYAGAPLTTHDGLVLGSICLVDTQPKTLTAAQIHLLKVLAKRVIQILEFDFSLNIMKQLFLSSKDAENKLRSFFESSAACHLLIGRELDILAFNKNIAVFLKRMYNVQLYDGINVNQILEGLALERFTNDYQRALSGEVVEFEREVDYSTEKIWWRVMFAPCYNLEGEIIGISYNAMDISERKQAEYRVQLQNESLRKVAYMQSHELRKSVASVLGFMEIFKQDDYQADKLDLQMMEKAVEEMDQTIRSIVSLSDNLD